MEEIKIGSEVLLLNQKDSEAGSLVEKLENGKATCLFRDGRRVEIGVEFLKLKTIPEPITITEEERQRLRRFSR